MKKRAFGKLHKDLFYIPRHGKLPEKVFGCRMVMSLLTILACAVVMMSSAFALFYTGVKSEDCMIESAFYSVTIDNTENGSYICPLAYEDIHVFEIEADGTATTGYCKIQVGDNIYYTEQTPHGTTLTLTVKAAKSTPVTITPQWGRSANYRSRAVCGEYINHSSTPYAVYEVEPTARLESIAEYYGVTEKDIVVYNNLSRTASSNTNVRNGFYELEEGFNLKIPGVDINTEPYTVPYSTYVVEPTATLDAISEHYGISLDDIIAFNDISGFGVGMSLKIPNADPELPDYAVSFATYVVEPTARLSDIAEYYDVSKADILAYNNISRISAGMVIDIPGVDEDTTPYAVPYARYTVEPTATLSGISSYYGVSAEDILEYNHIDRLTVGLKLKIPGVHPDTPRYVAPVPESEAGAEANVN